MPSHGSTIVDPWEQAQRRSRGEWGQHTRHVQASTIARLVLPWLDGV
ncbi:MAG TPA: hypothetical protein VEC76_19640 [Streptosporangiaceae bacterium]|nr:hypothetical protein [Streptosporangiaceae bacterium]